MCNEYRIRLSGTIIDWKRLFGTSTDQNSICCYFYRNK